MTLPPKFRAALDDFFDPSKLPVLPGSPARNKFLNDNLPSYAVLGSYSQNFDPEALQFQAVVRRIGPSLYGLVREERAGTSAVFNAFEGLQVENAIVGIPISSDLLPLGAFLLGQDADAEWRGMHLMSTQISRPVAAKIFECTPATLERRSTRSRDKGVRMAYEMFEAINEYASQFGIH